MLELQVCFGSRCASPSEAWSRTRRGWLSALPPRPPSLESPSCQWEGRRSAQLGCSAGAELFAYTESHRDEAWDLRRAVRRMDDMHAEALDFVEPDPTSHAPKRRTQTRWRHELLASRGSLSLTGWAPLLVNGTGLLNGFFRCTAERRAAALCSAADGEKLWRSLPKSLAAPWQSLLPCSQARGEDAAALRTFFTDWRTGSPIAATDDFTPVFLEIGALDGRDTSNTWSLETCLGWRGILVEALPQNFERLIQQRPRSLNLRVAACASHSVVSFSDSTQGQLSSTQGVVSPPQSGSANASDPAPAAPMTKYYPNASEASKGAFTSECGPLGDYLGMLHVARIDLAFVDVEGSEYEA